MAWTIEYLSATRRQLRKLDPQVSRQLVGYMRERVLTAADPHTVGKALTGNWAGRWRYRVGDYRVICQFRRERLIVMVVRIGHRSEVYDRPEPPLEFGSTDDE